jgi:histone acetyltransferase 1
MKRRKINIVFNKSCEPKFVDWCSRLETLLMSFIDAASVIDREDSDWIIYLLYQQYQNDHGQTCYAPIGFITVYLYYTYPDKKQTRIRWVDFSLCFLGGCFLHSS